MTAENIGSAYCRLCGDQKLDLLVSLGELPIAHRYISGGDTPEEKYSYNVHTCEICGLHQIIHPISADILYRDYNYCFTSWKPEPHRDHQIDLLTNLSGGTKIFEIGCNDGTFLDALKSEGFDLCVGVEPNPLSGKMARDKGHAVFQDLLTPSVCTEAVQAFGQFDNVVSRHVIEHISDLQQFFTCVDMVLKPGGLLMLDAPDCGAAIEMGDASILWEEHVNYFTEATMQTMLHGFGYEIVAFQRYLFTGESLTVIARQIENQEAGEVRFNKSDQSSPEDSSHRPKDNYGGRMEKFASELRGVLAARRQTGETVALFGVGARGVMTVNALDLKDSIDVAFDDQPEKQGMYMPGSGLAIRDPATAREYSDPMTCLLAVNNENEEAVMKRLTALSGQNITFSSLFSPKDIWRELEALRG